MKKILMGVVLAIALIALTAAATRINLTTQSIVGGTNYGVLYQSASGIPATITGASGTVLTSTGTGSVPIYASAVGATLSATQTFTGVNTFSNASSTFAGNATTATTATTATNVTNALGQGQTRQSLVRALNTPYTNSTALPIFITVTLGFPVTSLAILTVNGAYVEVISNTGSTIAYSVFSCIILPGESYEILVSSGTPTIQYWTEIR